MPPLSFGMSSPRRQAANTTNNNSDLYRDDSESNDDSRNGLPPIPAKAREYRSNTPRRAKTGGLEALFEASIHSRSHGDKNKSPQQINRKVALQRSKSGGSETLGSLSSHVPGHAESTTATATSSMVDRRENLMRIASSSAKFFLRRAPGKSKSGPLEKMMMTSQSTHSLRRRGVTRSKSSDSSSFHASGTSFTVDSDVEDDDGDNIKLESKLAQLSRHKSNSTAITSSSNGTDESSDKSSVTRKGRRKRRSKTSDNDTSSHNSLSGLEELPEMEGKSMAADAMTVQTDRNGGRTTSRRGSKDREISITQSISNLAVLLSPRQKAAAAEAKSKSRRSRSKSTERDITTEADNGSIKSKKTGRSRSKSAERKIDGKDLKQTSRRSRSKVKDGEMEDALKKERSSKGRSSSRTRRTRSKSGDRNPAMAELATITGNVKNQPSPSTPTSIRRRRVRRPSADSTVSFAAKPLPSGEENSNSSDTYTDLNDVPPAGSPPLSSNGSVISASTAARRQSRRDSRRASKDSRRSRSNSTSRSAASARRKSISTDDKPKSKSEGSVLIKMSPEDFLRLKRAREEQVMNGAKSAAKDGLDDTENDDPSNSAFDEAWNTPQEAPSQDIESLIQAVLNSKLMEPRSRQESRKKDEIVRLRSYLMDAMKLADNMESARTKQLEEEHENMFVKLQEQTEIIMEYRTQITYLEEECELRKKQHSEIQEQLDQSHEHAEALLAEVEELESHVLTSAANGDSGEGGNSGASLKELMDLRKRAKELEEELHNAQTVPQLQINDLDTENKTLQARLKAEKLDTNAKLSAKDEMIEELRRKLDTFEAAGDVQDMDTARQKLQEARDDATAVRKNLEIVDQTVEELRGELDRLLQKNADVGESKQNLEKANTELSTKVETLNTDILEWMDKAYKWKEKADVAQRKMEEMGGAKDDTRSISTADTFGSMLANQSMFLQAAMEKTTSPKNNKRKSWGIFLKGKNSTEVDGEEEEESANAVVIRTLQEQKDQLEDTVALLQAENDQIEEDHQEELKKMKELLEKLESENAAIKKQQQQSQSAES